VLNPPSNVPRQSARGIDHLLGAGIRPLASVATVSAIMATIYPPEPGYPLGSG